MSLDSDNKPQGGVVQGLAAGAGITIVGGGIIAAILSPQYRPYLVIFVVTLLVFLVIAGVVLLLVRRQQRKRRADSMGRDVKEEFDRQSEKSSDQETRTRLEAMKRKFMLLIDRLRSEGHRNIYEMPWYLTIGPSGTGKSWVLKGAGLEPLEEVEWKGGTFLIDWWTCGEALVLDTAGGVVFGEEYDMPEWKSLLALLKRHRPQCPINGLLIVIPAQMLLLEEDELPDGWFTLEKYAETLRMQIRKRLQTQLGIRFPIYFTVTQCDRVPGFREFSDALHANGGNRDQMLGWSNPVEVGSNGKKKSTKSIGSTPSDPELEAIGSITSHFHQVAEDVRRQRLLLLEKYVGAGAQADVAGMDARERATELFAFADCIQNTITPRLQEFLTKIFRNDPSLPKPPYVRGVYLTSALREGAVLDRARFKVSSRLKDLALPGGADRQQVKPFFLKDLCFTKAFPEAWLVTPLVEASQFLKQKRRTLMLSVIAATTVFLLAVILGGYRYLETVGTELTAWNAVTNEVMTSTNYWLPVITNGVVAQDNLDHQEQLAEVAAKGLQHASVFSFRWLFPSGTLDDSRRSAQLKLFEHGVIMPLADSGRDKLRRPDPVPQNPDKLEAEIKRYEGGLVAIMELELCPTNSKWVPTNFNSSRDRVMGGLVNLVLANQTNAPATLKTLTSVFDHTYADKNLQKKWPPTLPGHVRLPAVEFDTLIAGAFSHIGELQNEQLRAFSTEHVTLTKMLDKAGEVRTSEESLLKEVQHRGTPRRVEEAYDTLNDDWKPLEASLNSNNITSFRKAFADFSDKVVRDSENKKKELRGIVMKVDGALGTSNALRPELDVAISKLSVDVSKREIARLTNFAELMPMAAEMDSHYVTNFVVPGQDDSAANPGRVLDRRLDVYDQVISNKFDLKLPRYWDRDVFEDHKDPVEVVNGILVNARATWDKLATPAFAGITNEDRSASEIMSGYVAYVYFDRVLAQGQKKIKEVLDQDYASMPISSRSKPGDTLEVISKKLGDLKQLNSAWDQLISTWKTQLGGRDTEAIGNAATALADTHNFILDAARKKIEEDQASHLKGFPFERESADLATPGDVLDSYNAAMDWQKAVDKLAQKERINSLVSAKDFENLNAAVGGWLDRFKDLIDNKSGGFQMYEINTALADRDFKANVGTKIYDLANLASGTFRILKIQGDPLQLSDDKSRPIRVRADKGLDLEVEKSEQLPTPVPITDHIRYRRWTVIDLLQKTTTQQPPFYVPIEIKGDKGAATLWITIQPVRTTKDQP